MNDKLNVQDLINSLSSQNNVSKEEAEKFIIEFFSTIELGLTTDEFVKIKDFGTFKLTLIQERESVDVNTQEKIIIPSHQRVSFQPSQTLKSLVNKPFAHFETTPLNEGIVLDNVEQESALQLDENDYEDLIEENEHLQNREEESTTSILNTTVTDEMINLVPNSQTSSTEEIKDDDGNENSVDDSSKNETANIEIEEEKEKDSSDITTPTEETKDTKTPSKNVSKSKKRAFSPWYMATALIMIIVALIAYYNYYRPKDNHAKQSVEDSETPKPIKESTPIVNDTTTKTKEATVQIDEPLETIQMIAGKTLRLIALDKYGSREFWVYIYFKNKDKIQNPNVIPIGLKLELPRKDEYDIDPNNPESVAKAKKLGDEIMKKY